jgi:ribonucleoside-triphosphate reductase
MIVIKRDGRTQEFSKDKIYDAVYQAAARVDESIADEVAEDISDIVEAELDGHLKLEEVPVDTIHDTAESFLMANFPAVAKEYIIYRQHRTNIRESKSDLMDTIEELTKEMSKENANTDPSAATKMYQIASAASRKFILSRLMKPEFAQAHINGDIHIHDLDYYDKTINCMTHDLGKMLREGFDNGVGYIRPPKRIGSACALTAIILQSMQNNFFGGQAIDFADKALAPYTELEYRRRENFYKWKLMKRLHNFIDITDVDGLKLELESMAKEDTEEAVYQAMEALVYNLNTMKARSGNQVPFTSFNFGTDTSEFGRMVTRNLLLAFKAGLGNGEPALFPNLCFRVKKGINANPGDPNYDLFRLALECAGVRMNPTFAFMDSTFNAPYGEDAGYMGCRTRVLANINGESGISAKGNLFFTTINLPRLAIEHKDNFFEALDEVVDLVIDQLLERYNICCKLKVKDLPFVMAGYYMGSEGLSADDYIEPAIKNGTLSAGFIGLAETLLVLTGKHHGKSAESQQLGLKIIKHLRKRMDEATEKYHLNFTLLATPAEGLSGRFLKIDRKKYGVIPGVTENEFYTNSFHVPVYYKCSYSHKIATEAPYHDLTNAGHISYVEFDAVPKNNIDALETIVKYMAEQNMGYAGINFPIDHCRSCGYEDVINDSCPKCGSKSIRRIRRITGYLSDQSKFNDGKYDELKKRVSHA